MSIDYLNAHCGLGSLPGPRPSQGRLCLPITVIDLTVHWAFERHLRGSPLPEMQTTGKSETSQLFLFTRVPSLSKWATFRTPANQAHLCVCPGRGVLERVLEHRAITLPLLFAQDFSRGVIYARLSKLKLLSLDLRSGGITR